MLTLEHVIRSCPVKDIVVFPNPDSLQPLHFSKKIKPTFEGYTGVEAEDIRLLAVEKESFKTFRKFNSAFLDMEKMPDNGWASDPESYDYIVIGYPNADREIDYDKKHIRAVQHGLNCEYAGESIMIGCEELNILEACGPQDVDGYSGAPVFASPNGSPDLSKINFCGVCFRGTFESRKIHFIPRAVIDALSEKLAS